MSQKASVLNILQILTKHSNEDNPLNANQLLEYLEQNNIFIERKAVYRDIQTLIDTGYDIQKVHENNIRGYYLSNDTFEIAELRLLIDAINASKFISETKTNNLLAKLLSLTNVYDAKKITRNISYSQTKSKNEVILYNVDEINLAINEHKQITFKYFDLDVNKQKKYRERSYVTIPYSLLWDQDKYYCIGYSTKHQDFTHYRVDKMENIISSEVEHEYLTLDLQHYSQQIFGMFQGEKVHTTLRFPLTLTSLVYDQFSTDVLVSNKDETHFTIITDIIVSPVFFGWLFQLNTEVEIIAPASLKEQYLEYCQKIIKHYLKNDGK